MTQPALQRAVVRTLAYADIFDHPLNLAELFRYLHGEPASIEALERALQDARQVERAGPLFMLPGRAALAQVRETRARVSARLWPAARRWGRRLAQVPYVRMVAVTGALAVDNAGPEADIDYFIVAQPGRVWTCRLLTLAVVRLAAATGVQLCPNYFLSLDRLALPDRSIFTARELAQMVPLAGAEVYAALRQENAWADALLPNASGPPPKAARSLKGLLSAHWAERPLNGRFGARLERWEMQRKISRFTQRDGKTGETVFGPDVVQGHFEGYRARTLAEYERRLAALVGFP